MKLTLFWRLFLSMVGVIVVTIFLSVWLERWLTHQAFNQRMNEHIARLSVLQQDIAAALAAGDDEALRRIYRKHRGLAGQISVSDIHGQEIFPLPMKGKPHLTHGKLRKRPPKPPLIEHWHSDVATSLKITTPEGEKRIIELSPRLPLNAILETKSNHWSIQWLLLLLLSVLVCYGLSRALSQRIKRLQRAVRQIGNGDYPEAVAQERREDELGALAQDIGTLAEKLQRSEAARKQMLSDISHELRSPLARMSVAAELIREENPQAEPYIARVQLDIDRLNTLIADIITIQSLALQQGEALQREHCDIDAMIDSIGHDASFEYRSKEITWQHQRIENARIAVDIRLLHSALENIIRNAFMHSPPRGKVSVKLAHETDRLTIDISDEGEGITQTQDLARIFMPFVRLDEARQRQTGGYGLGLAIAKAAIEAHGGSIEATHRAKGERGLRIFIQLPLNNQ